MRTDARPVLCRLRHEIERRPGLTAAELARALFGPDAAVSRLQLALSLLDRREAIQRRGGGGRDDPYRYFPGAVAGRSPWSGEGR